MKNQKLIVEKQNIAKNNRITLQFISNIEEKLIIY